MDLTYPPEAEAFRSELAAWLAARVDDTVRAIDDDPFHSRSLDRVDDHRRWSRSLADAGFAAVAWPQEWGGRGASVAEQVVLAEELDAARAPSHINDLGMMLIAPAIAAFGTPEQQAQHLPRMARADDVWSQGFSEPDAGSDLAALTTRAVRDGDHYVVTGRKVWNTLGHVATRCELLVRTDPDRPRHRGITCLLLDLTSPGVQVRPIRQIDGGADFNELVLDEVAVPVGDRLGPENAGWKVAMTTLEYERVGVLNATRRTRRQIADLIERARTTPLGDGRMASEDRAWRHRLAALHRDGEHLQFLAWRHLSSQLKGRPPGPAASLAKLYWSELAQRVAEVAAELAGPDGDVGAVGREVLYARAYTIASGTTQVNKNVVAERVLGLPRGG